MIKARSYPDFKEFIKGFVASVKAGDRYDFRTYQNAILPLTYSSPWPEADMAPLKSPEMFTYKPDYKVPYTEDMLYSVGAQMVTADFFMDLQYAIDQGKDVVTVYAEWLARVKPYSMLNAKLKDAIKPPVVTKQPTSQTVNEGATLTLSLEADNAIGYQWMKGEEELGNGSEATYVKDAVKPSDAGSYKCVVQGEADTSVESNAVTVNVNPLPVITKQPTSQTVKEGQAVSVSVEADHADAFQWLKDGVNVEGANKATLAITAAKLTDAGAYTAKVTSKAGSVTSSAATITVNPLLKPVITQQPVGQSLRVGESLNLLVKADNATGYQWKKDGENIPSATKAAFSKDNIQLTDAGSYTCVVTGEGGAVTSSAAVVGVEKIDPPVFTKQPAGVTTKVGQTITLTTEATGADRYEWTKDGEAVTGAYDATYTKANATEADSGTYQCKAVGEGGETLSTEAKVTVNALQPPVFTKQPEAVTTKAGQTITLTAEATHANTFQWLKDGVNVEGANKATFTKANAVVGDSGSYQCKAVGDDGETLSAAAKVTVNALQPPVFTKQPEAVTTKVGKAITLTAEATNATSYSWLKDGKAVEGANAATFTKASAVEADSGSYQCKAVGTDGETLSTAAKVTVNPLELPAITVQPTDQTLTVGGALNLSVTATGATSYQWKHDGKNIEGANAATYTKDAVAAEDAGSYSVTVIGVDGNVDSKAVNVVVNPAAAEGGA